MKWSRKKPKEAGWYWFKDDLTDRNEVVEVTDDGSGLHIDGKEVSFYVEDADKGCWFAGPVPEPQE